MDKKIHQIDINQVNNFIFSKHNIIPNNQALSLHEVVNNHLGLHAARIGTPYMTLCSRLINYNTNQLTQELYEKKSLVKLRCMRKTLHISTMDIAPILFNATIDQRMSELFAFFKQNNIPIESIDESSFGFTSFLGNKKLSSSAIEEWIQTNIPSKIKPELITQFSKKVLKYYWEKGLISYVNTSEDWEKENRKYVLTSAFYPNLNLSLIDPHDAKEKLVVEYIKNFGPVTLKDISWWSGINLKTIVNAIKNNESKLEKIHVNGFKSEFLISSDVSYDLINLNVTDYNWTSLLAFEDPSLKGYFESRTRYVDEKHIKSLFNPIGEVYASIIHNGRAIGTWKWNKKTKKIELDYFENQTKSLKEIVNSQKEGFEEILFFNQQRKLF